MYLKKIRIEATIAQKMSFTSTIIVVMRTNSVFPSGSFKFNEEYFIESVIFV